ncbi:MAG: fibrobacter succinogenes major paralogous domain-containing protein [Bacteroidetes bacterium]|nr:fibrobacter succinogenes major paralogous domain-containing protein [Bacteroidota bacterium]
MKKSFSKFYLLATLGLASVVFTSAKDDDLKSSGSDPKTTDTCVVINGVKWATRNVDAFGTFAEKPESAGMFYQWNRKKAWSATGEVANWDSSVPTGTTWEKSNDPSPKGWRVPTKAELQSLFDTEKVTNVRTTQNGVNGRKFTDRTTGNSLLLPAAGYRDYSDGALYGAGVRGFYWSSTPYETVEMYAYAAGFYEGGAYVYYDGRRDGLSVRCVLAE